MVGSRTESLQSLLLWVTASLMFGSLKAQVIWQTSPDVTVQEGVGEVEVCAEVISLTNAGGIISTRASTVDVSSKC